MTVTIGIGAPDGEAEVVGAGAITGWFSNANSPDKPARANKEITTTSAVIRRGCRGWAGSGSGGAQEAGGKVGASGRGALAEAGAVKSG